MQKTISLAEVLAKIAPVVEDAPAEGRTTYTFQVAADEITKVGRKIAGSLKQYDLLQDVTGAKTEGGLVLTFGVPGGSLPLTWLPRTSKPTKVGMLAELEKELEKEGVEAGYFNSSAVQGLAISDERIPFGLQFQVNEEGKLVAKILKSASVSGGKTWVSREMPSLAHAIGFVGDCLSFLS
jgi:hypothetical protein